MTSTSPTIGGDPEFFILEKNKKGYSVITADRVLPSKEAKRSTQGGSVFFDGVQAEVNPVYNTCREFFSRDTGKCMGHIYRLAKRKYPESDIRIAPLAAVDVTKKEMKGADSECFRFGCSPDFNIYTESPMKYPDGKKFMTRFAGGHVHLGFNTINYMKTMKQPEKLLNLVRMMDTFAGIMSIPISRGYGEELRRKWYGKAGTYRIQDHGLEYRTLSAFWLVSPQLLSLFTGILRDAFTIVYKGKEKEIFDKVDSEYIRNIIDTSNIAEATNIYESIIKPFYVKHDMSDSPMRFSRVVKVVDEMVKEGYTKYFDPYKTIHYWGFKVPSLSSDTTYYGIESFSKGRPATNLNKINKEV